MTAAATRGGDRRWLPRLLLAILLISACAPLAGPALAQEGGGLLRLLFPPREPIERVEPRRAEPRVVRPRVQRERQVRRERQPRRQPARVRRAPAEADAPVPAQEAATKLDDARTVLVVGDFLGGGLAEGLEMVFQDAPGIRIVDRTNGSSGFVRDDFYDWPGEIDDILEAEKPSVVVVMIGSNDRQEIDGQTVLSPAWTAEYESRIKEFTASIAERRIPLVWVGMPAFKSGSMTSGMLAFNDIYRRAAEATPGGVFVDIWDGFVDENGNFTTRGPDINGQTVQLRSSDGINLTKDGKRKVAFYVEKPLDRILGDTEAPEAEAFGPEIPPGLGTGTLTAPEINRTVPVSLDDPALDGGNELLGAAPRHTPGANMTPAERLKIEGVAPPPPPGRADDFLRRDARHPSAAATESGDAAAGPTLQ